MSVVPTQRGSTPPKAEFTDSSGEKSQTLDTTASHSQAFTPVPVRPSSSLRVFEDDELVAFRYRIRGLLGRGGMGEVYEAEDLELHERVALKVLRRELAERPGALEQLKREIALARKVSHPNVCRLFDVGFHLRTSASGSERICFFTMELLQGESLSTLLHRTGPLSPDEALPLVRQLCEGLLAAHEAGIVHRDLKSANVLLVPARPGSSPRAVITDFGLARLVDESPAAPVEPATRLIGTPAYMAPEQLEGKPVTPATDLYALGIILFELLTGARPFQGEDAWSTATQRLHVPAPSPRELRPELERQWAVLILRCLERQPERRFPHARAVLTALPAPRRPPLPLPKLQGRGRRLLSLLALLVGSVLAGSHLQFRPAASSPLTRPVRPSVALLGLVDRTGRPDTAWLSTQLSNALSRELRAGDKLRSFSTTLVDRTKTALLLEGSEAPSLETLARFGELLGCDFVVLGHYSVEESAGGSLLRLELRIQDTATGELLASLEDSGPLRTPLPLLSRVGSRLREALGVQGVIQETPLERHLPSSLEALRLYNEAWVKLRHQDGAGSQALIEKVIALDPAPVGPHALLAHSLVVRGERGRAREELAKLLSRPEQLTLKERLQFEALYTAYAPDQKQAADIYQRLADLFPDDLEMGLNLVHARLSAGEPQVALATLAKLREQAPPGFVMLLDGHEAKAALGARDFPRAQAAAARAASQAEAQRDWFSAATHRGTEAEALFQQGAKERAREAMRASIKLFQRAGNHPAKAEATRKLADMLPAADLQGRLQVVREAEALFTEFGSSNGRCMTLLDIGDYQHALGELHAALRSAREALPLCQGTRLTSLELQGWTLVGRVHRSLGDLDAAEASFSEALQLARKHQGTLQTALGLTDLASLALARGDVARARQLHDEARRLLQEKGRSPPEDFELRQARLAFEEGDLEEAGRLADAAVTTVPELSVAEVHHLRARLFLAQHHYKEANVALLEAGEPAPLLTRLGLKIQSARLRAVRGGPSEHAPALESLRELLARAQELGWLEGQYEARLALGEVELASGRAAAGLARLKALERDATKSGWVSWARKAASLR
jgi:serine/threonine protein kinase/tetratricopeptide (TPR) repeat protein